MSGAGKTAALAAGLFLLNAAANVPLFLPGEHKYRDSIEGGYASMARFLSEHPNPFGWNPVQYRGLPTHDWYLPVVPYSGALAIRTLPFLKPEHVYRLVVVTLTCLGPVTLFLFVLEFTRQRGWALFTALLYSLCSTGYLLFPAIKSDQGFTYVPWRIQVLVKYGEGPHNVGLMLIPLALIACWRAAVGRRFWQLALAGLSLAAVVLTNWIAAVALAWCCLMMLVAGAVSRPETGFLGRRVLLASAIGYALAAFWLTPSYLITTFFNWPTDAFNYKVDATKYVLGLGLAGFPLLIAWAFRKKPERYYFCYLLLCLSGFAWVVTAHYWWKIDIIPEARRYALEVEFFLFAAVGELLRIVVPGPEGRRRDWVLVTAGFCFAFLSAQPGTYLGRTWIMLRPAPRETTIEYHVAEKLASLRPEGRVFVSGGTRFRLNSWFLIPQLGGTFESGLRNRGALELYYHVQRGPNRPQDVRFDDALNMLRAAGVEYMAFHGKNSREHWRDVWELDLAVSQLEKVWSEGDDAIYRVPFSGLANFVSDAEVPRGIPVGAAAGNIEPYVRAIEADGRPRIKVAWEDTGRIILSAPSTPARMRISLRVSYDNGWRAWQDGQGIPVKSDPLGNLLLEPRAADRPSTVQLEFGSSWQQIFGTGVSLLAAAACLGAIIRERRRLSR